MQALIVFFKDFLMDLFSLSQTLMRPPVAKYSVCHVRLRKRVQVSVSASCDDRAISVIPFWPFDQLGNFFFFSTRLCCRLKTSVIGWLIWGLATSGMQSFVTLLDSSEREREASRRNTIHTVCHSAPPYCTKMRFSMWSYLPMMIMVLAAPPLP